MEKLVSIIIPMYNAEKNIERCLKSIINQSYKQIEIICVNDGSNDETEKICQDFAQLDHRIKLISKTNGGVCSARNEGLKKINGEYFTFVDADDFISSDAIEKLINNADKLQADIVVGTVEVEVKDNVRKTDSNISCSSFIKDENGIYKELTNPQFSSCYAKLYKSCILNGLFFDEKGRINEDGYFVFQFIINCKNILYIPDIIYYYQYNNNSASHTSFSEKYYDILYFRDKKVELMHEKEIDESIVNRVYINHSIAMVNRLLCSSKKDKDKEIAVLRKDIKLHSKPLVCYSLKDWWLIFLFCNCWCLYSFLYRRLRG